MKPFIKVCPLLGVVVVVVVVVFAHVSTVLTIFEPGLSFPASSVAFIAKKYRLDKSNFSRFRVNLT